MVHVPLMFISERHEFPSAPCLAEKKNLMIARVSMLFISRARHLTRFLSTSVRFKNKKLKKKRFAIRHMNTPLFPMTLSIPSYDIGKDVGLRTYQHPYVKQSKNCIITIIACALSSPSCSAHIRIYKRNFIRISVAL